MNRHRRRLDLPFGLPTLAVTIIVVGSLLLWGGISVAWLTHACNVPWKWAWIPAVATNGSAILASRFSMLDRLDPGTRRYATYVATFGFIGDVIAAGGQHYLEAASNGAVIDAHPAWGFVVGGLPSAMVGMIIHIIFRVVKNHRRIRAQAEQARLDATRAADQARQARIDREIADNRAAQERSDRIRETEAQTRAATAEASVLTLKVEADKVAADRAKAEEKLARAAARSAGQSAGQRGGQDSGQGSGQSRGRGSGKAGQSGGQGSGQSGRQVDVSDLLELGLQIADRITGEGRDLIRDDLVTGIRKAGRSCSTDRARALLAELHERGRTQAREVRRTGSDRVLQLAGGR